MEHLELFNLLRETFGENAVIEHVITGDEKKGFRDPFVLLQTESLTEIGQFLKDDERCQFDMLHCISGVDWPEYFESVYHLFSISLKHQIILKVRPSKDDPKVPSVSSIWPSANWHERETFDLMGIVYEGHPNLNRILLPEEWEGNPLRKDYEMPTHERLKEIGL